MKILEKRNFEFKAQFEDPRWLHSIKCVLLEQDHDPKYLTYKIKQEHLKPILITTDKFMTAEVDDHEIILELKIKTDGIYFEGMYKINFETGEIDFELNKPYLIKKEFVVPNNMDSKLVKRIEKFMRKKFVMANFCDVEFNKYFSDKYLQVFINYAGYLESLVKADNCKGCIYLYQHRLSGFCHYFYTKNESK